MVGNPIYLKEMLGGCGVQVQAQESRLPCLGWHLSVLSKSQLPGELVKMQISGLPSQPRYLHFKQTLQVDGTLQMMLKVSEQRSTVCGALFMLIWWVEWTEADRGQQKKEK